MNTYNLTYYFQMLSKIIIYKKNLKIKIIENTKLSQLLMVIQVNEILILILPLFPCNWNGGEQDNTRLDSCILRVDPIYLACD